MNKDERIFSIAGNNKGLWCPFKSIFCQEGYCQECQIYLDWQEKNDATSGARDRVRKTQRCQTVN